MYTVAETDSFKNEVANLLTLEERLAFFTYLSQHPLKGDAIPNTHGLRKIHRALDKGKSGDIRVIYYNMLDNGMIICLAVYAKSTKENLTPKALKTLKNEKQGQS